jgi:hypothetical protein
MNGYCSLEEAFTGPVMQPAPPGKKKKTRTKEGFANPSVPQQLSGAPDPDRPAERPPPANDILESPQSGGAKLTGNGVALDDMFPLPGETADTESWERAFMLEPDWTKTHNMKNIVGGTPAPLNGAPTLWRQIPEPAPIQQSTGMIEPMVPIPSELNRRLDALTRQLESLTTPTPLQSTAELFLFVAIGLLLLLAIDTLLRYATKMSSSARMSSVGGGKYSWKHVSGVGGRRLF